MTLPLTLNTSHEYLATPPSISREGAPFLRRHHSTPSWSVQTPTPQYYYPTHLDMYREFSSGTDSSYPITPASDEEYRSHYVVASPPNSAHSSPQSSGTITPEMLRAPAPNEMPPSPLATPPDAFPQGISHTCAFPGCTFVSSDVEHVRKHATLCHSTPRQVPPPSLVMDDNGVASVSFLKVRVAPTSPSSYLQDGAFEDDEEEDGSMGAPAFSLTNTPVYPMPSPYGMTRSNTDPSSTPTRTPTSTSHFYHPYAAGTPITAPMTPASYARRVRTQHQHTHSLSDPSLAASIALLPSQHAAQYMSPPTPPTGSTPRRLGRSSRGNLPLVVSALDKSHACEECDKRFKRLEHLRRHHKTHTGERGFRCDVVGCGKWFSRSDNLMAHRRTHGRRGGRNIFVPEMSAATVGM